MIRITTTALALLGATAVLGLAACGSSDDSSTSTGSASSTGVKVTNAWARVTPETAKTGAAYMTISSPDGDTLTGVSVPSSIAGMAQLHETTGTMDSSSESMDSGDDSMSSSSSSKTMGMKEVSEIKIPAGGSVTLKPGGYHVMLIDLVKPLEVGQEIELTLTFEKAGDQTVTAEVREG